MSAASSTARLMRFAGGDFIAVAGGAAYSLLRPQTERERTRRDALLAFSLRVASAALLYLTQVVLARAMGGYEYGIYVFVWTWVLILGGISDIGLNVALIRLVPQYREQGRFDLMRGAVRGGQILALMAGTVVAVLGIAGLWAFEGYIANHYLLPAYLALVCVPLYALTEVQDGVGRGQAWIGVALVPPYILRPSLLLAAMVLAQLAGLPMEAKTAAAAAIVATWGSGIVQALVLQRRLDREIGKGGREYEVGGWLKISLPLLVIAGSELIIQNADIIIVSHFMEPTDAAIYFAAARTMSLIMFVHYAVGSAAANRFSALGARGDSEELAKFAKDAVSWTFWPSLAAAIVILSIGLPLLWLFGPQFGAGYPVMLVLVIGFLLRSAIGPAEFLLNMLGEQRSCAAVLATTAIMNVALNLTLVPMFGIMGAASATAVSLVAAALMNYYVVKARLGIDLAIWRALAAR